MTPTRRDFIKLSTAAGLALAAAPVIAHAASASPSRIGPGQPRLSLTALSLGRYFTYNRGRKVDVPADKALDAFKFIDYCAAHACDAELTTYFYNEETNDYLVKVRRHAYRNGVTITSAPISNNFSLPKGPDRDKDIAQVKKWIDHAAVLGTSLVRVFIGQTDAISREEADKNAIAGLEECGEYAGQRGIFLGIENHDVTNTPARLLSIIKALKNSSVGLNLDLGLTTSDPYVDFASLVPYAVNVHLKSDLTIDGKKSAIDYKRVAQILRDKGYRGWVALKYEAPEDPLVAVPRYLEEIRAALAG